MTKLYRIFDISLACDFELPELPESPKSTADLNVLLRAPSDWVVDPNAKVYEWRNEHDELICQLTPAIGGEMFEFAGSAVFYIKASGSIYCVPHQSCPESLLRHYLINQIIPRILGSQGRAVVHASAVILPNGRALAFLGRSGFGKSTLAAGFYQIGATLIADDCVILQPHGESVRVIGAFAGARLSENSITTLLGKGTVFHPIASGYPKSQAIVGSSAEILMPDLHAIYLLNDPSQPVQQISVSKLGGAEALMALVSSLFALNPGLESTTVTGFDALRPVARSGVEVRRLSYPRSMHHLQEVIRNIQSEQLSTIPA